MTEALPEPERRPGSRPLLGELLVNAGLVTPEVMAQALAEQQRTGLPIGRILVESGYIPAHKIAMALADQHGGPVRTEYGFATGHATSVAPAPLQQVSPEPVAPLRVVESVPEPQPQPEPAPQIQPESELQMQAVAVPDAAERAAEADGEKERLLAELERAEASLQDVVRLLEQEQEARTAAESAAGEARQELEAARAEREQAGAQLQAFAEALAAERSAREQAAAEVTDVRAALEQAQSGGEEAGRERAEREQAEAKLQNVAQMLAQEKSAREQAAAEAVELRAALAGAEAQAAELRTALEAATADPRAYPIDRHVLFVPGLEKYGLVERSGPPPAQDARLELDGAEYTVIRLGPAPFPDRVACAYLELAPASA